MKQQDFVLKVIENAPKQDADGYVSEAIRLWKTSNYESPGSVEMRVLVESIKEFLK